MTTKPGINQFQRDGAMDKLLKMVPYQNSKVQEHMEGVIAHYREYPSNISLEISTSSSLVGLYAQTLPSLFQEAHRHIVLVDDTVVEELAREYYYEMAVVEREEVVIINLSGIELGKANLMQMVTQEFGTPVGDDLPRYAIFNFASFALADKNDRLLTIIGIMEGVRELEGKPGAFAHISALINGVEGYGMTFDLNDSVKLLSAVVNEKPNQAEAPNIILADLTAHLPEEHPKKEGEKEEEMVTPEVEVKE